MEQIVQIVAGGLLLSLGIYWKGKEISEIVGTVLSSSHSNKPANIIKLCISLGVSITVSSIMVEPLISGNATIEVEAPAKERLPTVLDNLRILATPVGLLGKPGAEARVTTRFDASGKAVVNINLAALQSRVELKVYDVASTKNIVAIKSLYISPFVRRQLSAIKVSLKEE